VSTYVLIHGAWFGRYCWNSTKALLEQAGHKVVAIDLPGHGDDLTPVRDITLNTLVQRVAKTIAAQSEPSMGGIVLSQTAEKYPDSIERLVYVAAYLLQNGESLLQVSNTDADSQIGPYLLPDPKRGTIGIRPEALNEIFLHDCPADIVFKAKSRLQPDLIVPQTTPLSLTTENFGRVRRTYITTKFDRVVSPSLQKKMVAATPCDRVLEIATGHCPFAAQPEQLVQLLTSG
jgi:pimeloyl-ACP methyl ester carboxylesterase